MSLETAQFIHQLNPSNPSGADRLKEGDDHIRLLKAALKNTFPGLMGPLDPSVTHTFLNGIAALLVPVGAITLWHGTADTIPAGWALCDGSEVNRTDGAGKIKTPDLRGRAPVGADATNAVGTAFGQTKRTFTSTVAGAHSHTFSIPEHSHGAGTLSAQIGSSTTGATLRYAVKGDTAGGGSGKTLAVPPDPLAGGTPPGLNDPGHVHSATLSGTTGAAAASQGTTVSVDGHSHSVEIDTTQPSFALHFIIKV